VIAGVRDTGVGGEEFETFQGDLGAAQAAETDGGGGGGGRRAGLQRRGRTFSAKFGRVIRDISEARRECDDLQMMRAAT
jgi:hypothetical protein